MENILELGTLTERRRLEIERVPNLDSEDPATLRESLVRLREAGERTFSFSGTGEWLDCDGDSLVDLGQ